jgi:DNA processing protein
VVASGPDVVHPRRHRSLHARVRDAGIVVSELPPGTEPYRWSFPARNRIMAGLARMTLVVEAADPSGSLITAEFAKDLGRCVAAVPGRVTSSLARGTNSLLKDGATPISGTEDILDELFGVGVRSSAEPSDSRRVPQDPLLRAVLEAADGGDSVEAVAIETGRSIAETRAALGRLETDGFLVRGDLGGWERAAT